MKKIITMISLIAVIIIFPTIVNASGLLSKLEVEGTEPLKMSKSTHNLTLTTSLEYANIIATPANEGVTVTGAGKVDVKEGDNSITITATDGKEVETYTINLKIVKGNASQDSTNGNPNTGSFLPVSLVLLSIVAIAITVLNKKKIFNI